MLMTMVCYCGFSEKALLAAGNNNFFVVRYYEHKPCVLVISSANTGDIVNFCWLNYLI